MLALGALTLWSVDYMLRTYRFEPGTVAVRRFGLWRRYDVPSRVAMLTHDDGGFAIWDVGDGPFHVYVAAEFGKHGALALEVAALYAKCKRLVEGAS